MLRDPIRNVTGWLRDSPRPVHPSHMGGIKAALTPAAEQIPPQKNRSIAYPGRRG